MTSTQTERADLFHKLHDRPLLVLPNAWDVVSARVVEDCGATAVATSSAAVAWSFGTSDGDRIGAEPVLDLARRIVAVVEVPVSVDIESGYAEDVSELAETIRRLVETGAVGINIEDAHGRDLRPVEEQVRRLETVRAAAEETGVRLFVNARTDTYLRSVGDPDRRLGETLRRAEAYLDAGASGIFVPGVADLAVIEALASGIEGPLNILVGPGSPSIQQLEEVGVRRASAGSSIAQAVYAHVRRAVAELLKDGTYRQLEGELDYQTLNQLMGS